MDRKNTKINIVLGGIGTFLALLIVLFFNEINTYLFEVGEKYVSDDGSVNPESFWLVELTTTLLISFILLISILFFIDFYSRLLRLLTVLFDVKKIHAFFIKDELVKTEKLSKVSLILGTVAGIVLHSYFLFFGEIEHEGYLEEFSSIFLLVSGLLFLVAMKYVKKKNFSPFWYKTHQFTLLFLGIGLFLLFGEEINWGQRALEIEPSEFFKTYNFQNEISFHNFFNPLFRFVYPAVGMFSFIFFVFLWLFYKGEKNYYLKLFIPHRNLFFLIFWMAGASYSGDSEVYEEMLSVFFLLYSLRVLYCLKHLREKHQVAVLKKELSYVVE